jgi:4-hydroxy-2-oxoheptanedioate aldolase
VVFAVGRMFHHNIIQYLGMAGGFDGFWIDVEHGGLTVHDVEIAAIAGRAHGLDCFVRLPPTDYATVTRCFECGATGVMGAQITSASHAEEFVRWSKYAPRGHRGMNPLGYDGGFGSIPMAEFAERHNRDSFVAIMIETGGAIDEVDEIAAIDGVDLLFVGPSDLSQALGVMGDFTNQKCIQAIDRVAAACRLHGKHWGAVTPNPTYATMLIEKGCTLLTATNDVKLVAAGLSAVKAQYADLF